MKRKREEERAPQRNGLLCGMALQVTISHYHTLLCCLLCVGGSMQAQPTDSTTATEGVGGAPLRTVKQQRLSEHHTQSKNTKLQLLQETLNRRGVFDDRINAVRAESMLHVALDTALKKEPTRASSIPPALPQSKPSYGQRRRRRHGGTRSPTAAPSASSPTTATSVPKMELLAQRISELEDRVRRGTTPLLPGGGGAGGQTSATALADPWPPTSPAVASPVLERSLSTSSGGGGGGKRKLSASRLLPQRAVSLARRGSLHSKQPHRETPAQRLNNSGQSTAVSPPSVDPEKPAEAPEVPITSAASYIELSFEHADYHDVAAEERALLKRRDDRHRATDPVQRYHTPWLAAEPAATRRWDKEALRLDSEQLASRQQQQQQKPSRATSSEAHHATMIQGEAKRDARRQRRVEIGRRLEAQAHLLDPTLRLPLPLGGGVAEESSKVESSDDGEEDLTQLLKQRASSPDPLKAAEAVNACELLETTVACLTRLTAPQASLGRASAAAATQAPPIERDRAILRSIMLHTLDTLQDKLRSLVLTGTKEKPSEEDTDHHHHSPLPPFAYRLLRSWTKGVEMLLCTDLELPHNLPFSLSNSEHVEAMVRYYCLCQAAADRRSAELIARWKANADRALGVNRAVSINDDAAPASAAEQEAEQVLRSLEGYSSVSMGELTRMDVAEANLRFRQKEVAAAFLARFGPYLPSRYAQQQQHGEGEDPDEPPSTHQTASQAPVVADTAAARLRLHILRYVGVDTSRLRLMTSASASSPPHVSASIVDAMTADSLSSFINVFRTTWGRTPLAPGVPPSERYRRSEAIEKGLVAQLLRTYWQLLGEPHRGIILSKAQEEARRFAEFEARQEAQEVALQRATRLAVSPSLPPKPSDDAGDVALAIVTKQQILSKYRRKVHVDDERLARLRRAVECTDSWIGHERGKRAIRAEHLFDSDPAAPPAVAASLAKPGVSDASPPHSPNSAHTPTLPPPSQPEEEPLVLDPDENGAVSASKLESLRSRRLRELEVAWQELSVPYAQRLALHERWNAAPLKEVDHAARLYVAGVRAVKQREESVAAIMANESNTDERQRMIQRHDLFNIMCAAGHRCELAAKQLRSETGDTLTYRDQIYTDKMKDDFAMVSRMLRVATAPTTTTSKATAKR